MNLNEIIKLLDDQPKIIKLILALPVLDTVWIVYRILKSVVDNNSLGIIIGLVLLIFGIPMIWLFDIIFIIKQDTVWWF